MLFLSLNRSEFLACGIFLLFKQLLLKFHEKQVYWQQIICLSFFSFLFSSFKKLFSPSPLKDIFTGYRIQKEGRDR